MTNLDSIDQLRQHEIAQLYLLNCDGLVTDKMAAEYVGKRYGLTADEVMELAKKFKDKL